MAAFVCSLVVAPMALMGCGSGNTSQANLPPLDASQGRPMRQVPQENRGMSNTTKVVLLAGAAAAYYMYRKNQQKRAQGDTSQPQYYLSKNGRVYYRGEGGRPVWVTPPSEGFRVPESEARQYRDFQGYDGRRDGRDLMGLGGGSY